MALYERLMGFGEPKLPVHQFYALCHEVVRGEVTAAAAVAAINLDAGEQVEAQALIQRVTGGQLTAEEVHQVLCLAEFRMIYTTVAEVKTRLGV